MTLVFSCVTPDYVVQVSDRRLTRLNGAVEDDNANKAVIWNETAIVAYTGLAELGSNQRTDLWIAEVMRRHTDDLATAVADLGQSATELFASLPYGAALKRHAFSVVGFTSSDSTVELRQPVMYTVENYLGSDQRPLAAARVDFCTTEVKLAPGEAFGIRYAGAIVPTDEQNRIRRVMRALTSRSTGPREAARLAAIHVRRISNRNAAVGRNLMVAAIPRVTTPPKEGFVLGGGVMLGPPSPDQPTFYSLSDDGHEIIDSPIIISGAMTIADGMFSNNPAHYGNWPNRSRQPRPR